MKKEYWLGTTVALLFIVIGLVFGLKKQETAVNSASPGTFLLAQSLPDLNGKSQALAQWKGKTIVANFWATWCPPCIEEMPELSALQEEGKAKNIQIIGIGIDSVDKIQEFSYKHKISYPLYVAGMQGAELAKEMGNSKGGLPFTLLITPDGQVKRTYTGRLDMTGLRRDLGLP
ncbi:MAG: TlpA family protein disulfide reductase [Burkholderiales bacterium]|nr:TlpA family protein disulfide reductase [Burkholderiales bacterium]